MLRHLWRASLLLGLAMSVSCGSESPPSICEHKLTDGTCVGVLQTKLCRGSFCTEGCKCARKLYVMAGSGGDGSLSSPFGRIQYAASAAGPGDCIAVAAGEYEQASLPAGVSLLGAGADVVRVNAPAGSFGLEVTGSGQGGLVRGVTIAGDGRGLTVRAVHGLRVESTRIEGVRVVGLDARESTGLVLDHVEIKKTRSNEKGEFGIGVLLADGTRAELTHVTVADNEAQGVLVQESSVKLVSSVVVRAARYGVLIDCVNDPACWGDLASSIDGSTIDHCGGVGLWARGARLSVTKSDIGYTGIAGGVARGVELDDAILELSGNRIHHNEGQGVLIDAAVGRLSGNTIDENLERGVWLQGVWEGLAFENNDLIANRKAALGATGCTGVTIKGGQLSNTKKMPTGDGAAIAFVGDGLQVLGMSEIAADSVRLEGNERVGVLIDAAKAAISNASIRGGEDLVVVQNASVLDQTLTEVKGDTGQVVQTKVPAKAYFVSSEPVSRLKVGNLPIPIP